MSRVVRLGLIVSLVSLVAGTNLYGESSGTGDVFKREEAGSSDQAGRDLFVIVLAHRDLLRIEDLDGNCVAPIALFTVNMPVTVGDTSFRVSYGLNQDRLKEVMLAPDPDSPQDFHFEVLHQRVDVPQSGSVVLIFSADGKRVTLEEQHP